MLNSSNIVWIWKDEQENNDVEREENNKKKQEICFSVDKCKIIRKHTIQTEDVQITRVVDKAFNKS